MSTLPLTINGSRARGWALWVVPAVALAALVGWEIDWGRQLVRMPSAPPAVDPKPVTAAALPEYRIEGGLPAHAEIVARTLFNATRRPAPVLASDGPHRLNPGRFQLVGTTVPDALFDPVYAGSNVPELDLLKLSVANSKDGKNNLVFTFDVSSLDNPQHALDATGAPAVDYVARWTGPAFVDPQTGTKNPIYYASVEVQPGGLATRGRSPRST